MPPTPMKKVQPLVPVGYRIPADVRDWLNEQAAKQERSANWLLNKLLAEGMQRELKASDAKTQS
jgi:hypothetical protein